MGVDTSIKVRLIKENTIITEVIISEQDNSLAGLFNNSGTINYTSIELNMSKVFNKEELALFNLNEQDEMTATSIKIDAKGLLKPILKAHKFISKIISSSLLSDLSNLDKPEIEQEIKERRQKSVISDYLHFESSLSSLIAILNTANQLDYEVQIVLGYY